MNDDKNLLGRVIALALLLGAAYGVESIARGGLSCPFGGGSSCAMGSPEPVPGGGEKAPLLEKIDADRPAKDEDAKPGADVPAVPPGTPK